MSEVLSPERVVREYWRLMATNDFFSVIPLLAPTFCLEWPQSNERIRGAENFAKMNAAYPTSGLWSFETTRFLVSGDEVVTQTKVSNETLSSLAITFFTVADGRITKMVEFWPEPYTPPDNRRHLTERLS